MAHVGTISDVWLGIPVTYDPQCSKCGGHFTVIYARNGGEQELKRLCANCIGGKYDPKVYRKMEYLDRRQALASSILPGKFEFY